MARSRRRNSERSSGLISSAPTNRGLTATYSWPSRRISQPPAAWIFLAQSETLPKVSGMTAMSLLSRALTGVV